MIIFYIFLAIFTGVLFAVSRAINSRLGTVRGALTASYWNHLVGFLFLAALFILLVIGGAGFSGLTGNHIPLYTYFGGLFGALFVAINSYVFPRIGALKAILLVTGAQIISGLLMDHPKMLTIHFLYQICGVGIILLGVHAGKKGNRIDDLLNDQSRHIEFNGHLTNHAKHAVVALYGLGASYKKIHDYYYHYATLTPYGYPLEPKRPSRHVITKENWQQYLGKRTSFSSYYDFFHQEEKNLGMRALLQQYIPILLPGWVGSLSHGTIHLGFALDVQNRCMTLEGLAYMAFSSVSCHPEKIFLSENITAKNDTVFDSVCYVASVLESEFPTFSNWVEEIMLNTHDVISANIHPELMRSGLQYRIAKMLAIGHPLIYSKPSWLDLENTQTILNQLYYVVTLLYVEKPGDFLLLHLITALFSMEKIIEHLTTEQQKYALNCFWVGMLCILFSRGEFPKAETLKLLDKKYHDTVDAPLNVECAWKKIIVNAMNEEEEHNPKMVYVLRRIWKRSCYRSIFRVAASYFTTTPILPKSFETPPTE